VPTSQRFVYWRHLKLSQHSTTSSMNSNRALALLVGGVFLPAASLFGGLDVKQAATGATPRKALLPVEIPAPIDVSADGQLMLLACPEGQGFELVNTGTGERNIVCRTPNTGYFATFSPDKKYVCFKDFQAGEGRFLQIPALYDIALKRAFPLAAPAAAAGNPVVSSRGQVAYTLGERLILLNADLSPSRETDLGVVANVLAFSPDGRRLAFSDPDEAISWLDVDTGKRGGPPAGSLRGFQPRFSPDGRGLLARRSNGDITGWRAGRSRNFGPAHGAAWLDNENVALVQKDVENFAVTQTRIEKRRFSGGAVSCLLTRKADAAVALNASIIALNAPDGVSLADARTGMARKVTLAAPPAVIAVPKVEPAPATEALTPKGVTTNGTTVKLTPVPYVNQVYDTDPDFPGGGSCCNATATIMAIQYFNRLPPHPITCTQGGTHTSYYGFYITGKYSYNGKVFDTASSAAWGTDLEGYYGGFGMFLKDDPGTSLGRSQQLELWITRHGLTSDTDDSATFAKAKTEINSNYPIVVLNSLTTAGHYITCIGYISGQYSLIFNDPYGNKNVSYPGKAGAGAIYDWPGYDNGYQNLNSVGRYIYARGTATVNTNWGSYWDLNAATTGAGAAPGGTWNSTSTNWSSSVNGTVATGPWAEQNAIFAAGTDATGAYTVSVNNTQVVANLLVQEGTVTFTGGRLYFLGTGSYFSNYVASGATAIFNTPFGGTASPDKWGPGTAVYNGASTSGGFFSHNEGTLALGNNSALGTVRLDVGDTAGTKVVTLKSADATAHTLANYLSWKAATCNFGAGGDLTFSGPININTNTVAARILCVSNVTTFSGVITNACGITKIGPGTLVLSGASANTYGSATANGYTTVSAGTLKLSKTAGVAAVAKGSLIVNTGGTLLLGAANQIGDALPMTLGGGAFQTAGFSDTFGTLKLTANSVIDLGAGVSVLTFAASSGVAWTAGTTLTISNWNGSIYGGGTERVLFGSSSSGLSAAQVGQLRFVNPPGFPAGSYVAAILSAGEVVPYTAAPSVTGEPQDKAAAAGSTFTLTSTVTGTPAPALQWRLNGSPLSGATSATLSLSNVDPSQSGAYSLMATNIAGSVTSRSAQVTVTVSAPPTLCGTACSTNGQFQFNVAGVAGCQYSILSSTDLVNWTPLQTNSSPFTFTDATAGVPSRFYRAQYLP
jgi:autotransporter-associated beta strand protein